MSERTGPVVIGRDGSVQVSDRGAAERLQSHAGEHELVLGLPGLVVLRQPRSSREAQTATRVLMAGEIVSRMTVMEVINVIANASWRGELHVMGSDADRVLAFDQGALKNAYSDAPGDRLGEVLYRTGALTREQLDDALQEGTPERPLGQELVDRGLIDQQALYQHLQSQAEQIFYNALVITTGHYVFRLPAESEAVVPAATLHIPVQHLLMEGVQRIDEMALFRERIPNSQMCPEPKSDAPARELEDTAARVLEACDGKRTLDEIARFTGLGEFETTKAVYHLLQQEQVALRSGARIDSDAARRLVSQFNDLMRDIFMAVATYGGIDRTRDQMRQWIHGNDYAALLGEQLDEDGSLDVRGILERLPRVEEEHPLESLHRALHELAAFALFTAGGQLPRDQEARLSRDINRRLRTIRI